MFKKNQRNVGDGIDLLKSLPDRSASCVVYDPQYRAVLDKLAFGNEGESKQKDRAELPQMSDETIAKFVAEIDRVLRSSGHLFLWVDKFLLVSGKWHLWMPDITPLREVDCLILDRERIGMGRRLRARWEAMIVLQKGPAKAEGIWKNRAIPDVCRAKRDTSKHPHTKPVALIQTLIECVTEPGDLVVDPAAGSYSTLDACRASARQFLGCDLVQS